MNVDEIYRDADRCHLMQFVELICESEYDSFVMFEVYCRLWERKRADEGEVYFILKQPIQMFNEVLRQETIPKCEEKADVMIFHWMADIYLYAHYNFNLSFEQAVYKVSPRWLYAHYSPLHETSLQNGWEKAVSICTNQMSIMSCTD